MLASGLTCNVIVTNKLADLNELNHPLWLNSTLVNYLVAVTYGPFPLSPPNHKNACRNRNRNTDFG